MVQPRDPGDNHVRIFCFSRRLVVTRRSDPTFGCLTIRPSLRGERMRLSPARHEFPAPEHWSLRNKLSPSASALITSYTFCGSDIPVGAMICLCCPFPALLMRTHNCMDESWCGRHPEDGRQIERRMQYPPTLGFPPLAKALGRRGKATDGMSRDCSSISPCACHFALNHS